MSGMNDIDIREIDEIGFDEMNLGVDDIENENQTLICFVIDESGSMGGNQTTMVQEVENFKQAVIDSKVADEMLVSFITFGNGNIATTGYQRVQDISFAYRPDGSTPLHDAIITAQKQLYDGAGNGYLEKLRSNGVSAKAAIAILSDGWDNDSRYSANDAKKAIELLKYAEIGVSFTAFGADAKGIAANLGVDPAGITDTGADPHAIRARFNAASKSAISASKSAGTGTSNTFFV